jgi:DNA polymerase-3 subunit gamma/tau
VGSLARIERLERRIGVAGAAAPAATPVATSAPVSATSAPAQASKPAAAAPQASVPADVPAVAVEAPNLTTQHFRDVWPDILDRVNKISKAAWMVAYTLQVVDFDSSGVLTLQFASQRDVDTFRGASASTEALRNAINDVLGVSVRFKPAIGETKTEKIAVVKEAAPVEPNDAELDELEVELAEAQEVVEEKPAEKPKSKSRNNTKLVDENARYGESLLREMLNAEPVDDKKNGR